MDNLSSDLISAHTFHVVFPLHVSCAQVEEMLLRHAYSDNRFGKED